MGRSEGGILAATGFQTHGLSHADLYKKFAEIMSGKKEVIYIQSSLRGARAVYDDGGHVDIEYNDQSYRLVYDNKRQILTKTNLNSRPDIKLFDSVA